jgi:anti-sigma28 factor (negative regulator of flagellin synthesis)
MNSIPKIAGSTPIQKLVNQPIRKQVPVDAPKQLPATDRLELSNMSQMLQKLKDNDIRTDKVADIKSQIESGTYENDQKLTVAADRLLDELFK